MRKTGEWEAKSFLLFTFHFNYNLGKCTYLNTVKQIGYRILTTRKAINVMVGRHSKTSQARTEEPSQMGKYKIFLHIVLLLMYLWSLPSLSMKLSSKSSNEWSTSVSSVVALDFRPFPRKFSKPFGG